MCPAVPPQVKKAKIMIITSIEELRLCFPAHAYDSIDPLAGVIDNSEHDFLQDKLGTPLYNALCDWYDEHPTERSRVNSRYLSGEGRQDIGYYNKLLIMAQRVVGFDAMSRAVSTNIISINNAGLNISTSDDYGKVDLAAVDTFKNSCIKEAHASVNLLLQALEEWTKKANAATVSEDSSSDEEIDPELKAITDLWKQSRYFYMSTASLIPTAQCLQGYVNIYDSREKFIQLLPDILFIQEENIANAIGDDFLKWIIQQSLSAVDPGSFLSDIIHRLRKTIAAMLVERTQVIKFTKEQRQQAHDDSVRLMQRAINDIRAHQDDILTALGKEHEDIFKKSPLYVAPAVEPASSSECHADSAQGEPQFENNRRTSGMFVTPFLN